MKYRTLGRSGLKVSEIGMGTFSFGGKGDFGMIAQQDVTAAKRLIDVCVERGVNLFDTANMYSRGLSEEIVGEALGSNRQRVVLTSKVRMKMGDGPNDEGISRYHLIRECENSLRRLKTDHIDVYFVHEWDGTTPVEEMVSALDTLVRQGKVRYVGCSNFSGWHIMKALSAADKSNSERFVTQQIHYTLEAREAEYELLPISVDQGLGVMVWSPLASGLLTGKYNRNKSPEGTRFARGWSEPPIRDRERLWDIVDVLDSVAQDRGATAGQVALAWALTRPAVSSLIVGGTSTEQFEQNIAAVDLTLSSEEIERLNQVSRPPYIYPYWHQHNFAAERFSDADWALHANYRDVGKV
ncbi:aldo/keto reductase [Rhizobium sp. 21-4511-3d]|jgi:aryl-alcohol dehydrogenase-like predicted oxidoreductase